MSTLTINRLGATVGAEVVGLDRDQLLRDDTLLGRLHRGRRRGRGNGPPGRASGRATVPERVYRRAWAVGDLVLWDNTGVMHRACTDDPTSAREMHRTTMRGDEQIGRESP